MVPFHHCIQFPADERIKPLRNPSSGRRCDEATCLRPYPPHARPIEVPTLLECIAGCVNDRALAEQPVQHWCEIGLIAFIKELPKQVPLRNFRSCDEC